MSQYIEEGRLYMDEALENLKGRLGRLRTGRPNASILYGITIDYYGTETPLEQLGQITVVEGRQLSVKLFDLGVLKDAERAINEANLGLLAQNDGKTIYINVPQLTEETRRDVAKNVSVYAEDAKVVVRNVRRDLNDSVKKDELPEDEERTVLEQIQALTDEFIASIDTIAKDKTAEIMTI